MLSNLKGACLGRTLALNPDTSYSGLPCPDTELIALSRFVFAHHANVCHFRVYGIIPAFYSHFDFILRMTDAIHALRVYRMLPFLSDVYLKVFSEMMLNCSITCQQFFILNWINQMNIEWWKEWMLCAIKMAFMKISLAHILIETSALFCGSRQHPLCSTFLTPRCIGSYRHGVHWEYGRPDCVVDTGKSVVPKSLAWLLWLTGVG